MWYLHFTHIFSIFKHYWQPRTKVQWQGNIGGALNSQNRGFPLDFFLDFPAWLTKGIFFSPVDSLLPQDEPGSAILAQLQPYPTSSTRFSPVHFDHADPSHIEADDVVSHYESHTCKIYILGYLKYCGNILSYCLSVLMTSIFYFLSLRYRKKMQ